MFITNEIEFEAAADQLEAYLLIDSPSDEEKYRFSQLARHMEVYVIARPSEQETIH